MIPLTVPEVRRVIARIMFGQSRQAVDVLAWSNWRRWHQQVAMHCHYKSRGHDPPAG
jgi:hypothetical protein